ncbi:MAG: UDP-N-acetylmuramate dehydrogenase [Spirochaetota bacterium]|nr:UDP-N-acetylmuramate dehydrogenase [Spirochaetota bacterium]
MNNNQRFRNKEKLIERLSKLGIMRLDESMRNHTSFMTGGPADILIYPLSHDYLREIVLIARDGLIPLTIIGGGSNLLVGDKGIRGIVIKLCENGVLDGRMEIRPDGLVYADSIMKKETFVQFCLDQGFKGMEFIAGIPGCLGGGIMMNAGTDMGNFIDILHSVISLNWSGTIETKELTKEMAEYRRLNIEEDTIILGSLFKLPRGENIEDIRHRIEENINQRRLKHPLDYPSAGSVFKNPPQRSSWELIDEAGLKGQRVGGAVVSTLHTNFIVNANNASSSDILSLMDHIKERVYSKFNILLESEIRVLGEI